MEAQIEKKVPGIQKLSEIQFVSGKEVITGRHYPIERFHYFLLQQFKLLPYYFNLLLLVPKLCNVQCLQHFMPHFCEKFGYFSDSLAPFSRFEPPLGSD